MMCSLVLAAVTAAPNVVFLSVDTLRADRLGCYGYPRPTSPNLDRFARDALVFDDCVCETPLTAPSFGSMLTSLYPRMTGLTRNGLRMPGDAPTVAESFQAAGYQTFCVQSNWTLKGHLSGLDRGFDAYDEGFHRKRWGFIKPERYADEVTRVALEQLARLAPDRRFFCWIHYSDPHAPYRYHRDFSPSGEPGEFSGRRDKVRARYDSEVAFTDHHIGRLLEAIPRENTFILFVADHGESLYEHDYLGHGRRIYQTCIRIPLMVAGPGIAPGRTSIEARGIDIGPTLLALGGLTPLPNMLGMNLLGPDAPLERRRVVETYGGAVPRLPGAKALMADRPPQRQGVLSGGWKLILDEAGRAELFHVCEDSMEETDRAAAEPERVSALRGLIEAWNALHPRGATKAVDLTRDDRQALESLGYLK
jgi:arylsulfatase A-like enzyme